MVYSRYLYGILGSRKLINLIGMTLKLKVLLTIISTESKKIVSFCQKQLSHIEICFMQTRIFQIIKNILRMFVRNDNKSKHRLKAIYNLYKTRKIQTSIKNLNFKFLIYPLNAAYDEQLLLRGTYIKDIYSSIQMLCNSLPLGVKLVIRQHPVDPGGLNYKKIKYLLSNNNNLHIVNHNIPLNKLINKSSGMITVNSTSAFDSLVNKKPVFVLGRTFYSDSKATTTVKDIRKVNSRNRQFYEARF